MSSRAKVKGTTAWICFRSIFNAPMNIICDKLWSKKHSKVFGYLSKQTNISHLELPLIMAGAIFLKQMKLVLVSAAGDDMIVVISINATEEGGKCQKIKYFSDKWSQKLSSVAIISF